MRRSFSFSVVVVSLAVLAPLMTTVSSSAATASCQSEARIVLKDLSVRLPSLLGERSTVILYQVKVPVTVDPACQTKAAACSGGLCGVIGDAQAQSKSGGAGVVIQLQRVDAVFQFYAGLTRWIDLGAPYSCRKNGANQTCAVSTLGPHVQSGDVVRAVCHWKSKQGTIDQNAKITVCKVNVFPT